MLSTRGAAAWFAKVPAQCQYSRRLDRPRRGRVRELAPVAAGSSPAAPLQPPGERPMTLARAAGGLPHQPAPQLHR